MDSTGRLTRDPEIKNTTTGKAVANFTLAVDRRFKNQDGQKEADFINCQAWGKTAEVLGQYTQKGSRIGVVGRLQVRSYDAQDGTKRWVTEVIVDELEFLESKGGSNSANTQQQSNGEPMTVMGLDEDFHLMADDDDIPF
mgnify:CR=1 FL=1